MAIRSSQVVVTERDGQEEQEDDEDKDEDNDVDNDALSRLGAYVSIKAQGQRRRRRRRQRQQASDDHHHRPLSDTIITNVLAHWTIGQDPTLYSWTETSQEQQQQPLQRQ